eukprot:TRINITY_DN69935_c0_g1_i1.p1 TRINITY_DN69935_c0_g1~~TRINITY_DN69935_c0_g1_i1.p1  ORF type:complete len:999 (+),score=390.42 TRINITY_DN69935_c0_g1_i1:81-2999(+)
MSMRKQPAGRRRSSVNPKQRRTSNARRHSGADPTTPRSGNPASWARRESRGGAGGVALPRRRSRVASLADSLRSLNDTRRQSVNADLDTCDRLGLEALFENNQPFAAHLTAMWYAALDHDPYLYKGQMDIKLWRQWARQVGLIVDPGPRGERRQEAETQTARVLQAAQIAMGCDTETMDQVRWLRALCHVAFFLQPEMDAEHERALHWMAETYLDPWLERYRQRNDNDGLQPGDGLFLPLECDRILYVYDTPLTKLFDRYRALDQHTNRQLSFDYMKQLNEYVELSELRDFCKDYGLFPKVLSFAEISKIAQIACFGKVLTEPTRQTQGAEGMPDTKELVRRKSGAAAQDLRQYQDEQGGMVKPEEGLGQHSDVGLGNQYVNPEGVTEPLLDRTMFMDCIMRIAQVIYQRTDKDRLELPSVAARIEALLRHMEPVYLKQFGREMRDDCDWELKGPPVLKATAENVACTGPLGPRGPCSGGYDIMVEGHNFCTKRSVYVKFFDPLGKTPRPFVVKAHTVKPRRVWVTAPKVEPTDVAAEVAFDHDHRTWSVTVSRVAVLRVECSNDRHNYTSTEPEQSFIFQDVSPPWYIPEDLAVKAHKVFQNVVSFKDRRNTRFMTRSKWRRFKRDYGIVEQILRKPRLSEDGERIVYEDKEDPHFDHLAQEQILPPVVGREADGAGLGPERKEDVILFPSFLRLLVRCFCEYQPDSDNEESTAFDHIRPLGEIKAVIEAAAQREEKKVEHNVEDIQDEIALTRKQIELVERKTARELDVYCGPVLCATLSDRPGYVTLASAARSPGQSGKHPLEVHPEGDDGTQHGDPRAEQRRQITRRKHRFLSCVIHDTNTEGRLLMHINTADSFDHLFDRLSRDNFDVAASADPATRKPTGRCWHLLHRGEKLGAMWDYCGHFANQMWQPQRLDADHPHITMTVYREHTDLYYIICFMLYNKARTVKDLRTLLGQRGYTLKTCLYKV